MPLEASSKPYRRLTMGKSTLSISDITDNNHILRRKRWYLFQISGLSSVYTILWGQ